MTVCLVAAAGVALSKWADPRPEVSRATEPARERAAPDCGASFACDWDRALASATPGKDGALWEMVRRWIGRDAPAVMDAVVLLQERWERKAWALSLWLASAPDDALAWASALGTEGEGLQVAAIRALAGRDPAGALAAAERLEGAVRLDAAKAALRVWAGVDPVAAWQAAQDVSVWAVPWSFAGLREGHEQALRAGRVKEWLLSMPLDILREAYESPPRRRALSVAVLDVWAESALQDALEAAVSTSEANVPPRWVKRILARWAATAPFDALAWASSLPPRTDGPAPLLRVEARGATLAAMAVHWPDLANQAMEEIGDWFNDDRQDVYNTVGYQETIRRFADTTDPRRVAAWFENHPDESLRSRHSDDVARAYARAYPEEALAWAQALPRGRQRTQAVWAALNVVTDEAPDRMAEMVLNLDDPDLRANSDLLGHLLVDWAKVDPVAALRWEEDHAPEQWNTRRRMATFNVWATYDPEAAAAHVENLADPVERGWAARHVLDGTFSGMKRRVPGKKGIVEHIPMIERLYAGLPPERRSKHVAYFLYRHYEHSDPHRAAEYKAEARDDHGDPWDFYPPD